MNDPYIEQLTNRVSASLGEWLGRGATLDAPTPQMARLRQSFFLRYAVRMPDGASKTLIVKIPRQPGMTTLAQAIAATQLYAATQREYASLVAVADAFADAGSAHFCIRPLTYLADWNALVMPAEPAQSLKQILLRPQMLFDLDRDWLLFERALTRAGAWLKIFHTRLGDAQIESLNARDLQNELDQEIDRLARALPSTFDLRGLRDAFAQVISEVAGTPMPMVTLHGDFNCGNILVAPDGRVGAIDTKRRTRGSIYVDLATLVTDLLTRKLQVVSRGAFIRPQRLARCQEAILKGYFDSLRYDVRLLNLFSALAAVRKWTLDEEMLASARGINRLGAPFIRMQVRPYFQKVLQKLLACF